MRLPKASTTKNAVTTNGICSVIFAPINASVKPAEAANASEFR